MATKYEYDRCGGQFDDIDKIRKITYTTPVLYRSYQENDKSSSKDLCENCNKQLIEWLKPLPKEAPTTSK